MRNLVGGDLACEISPTVTSILWLALIFFTFMNGLFVCRKCRNGQRCYWGKLRSVDCPWGRYTTFLAPAKCVAISSAVSIRRSSTRPSPALVRAVAKSSAASVSPSAMIMAAFFVCSAFSTRNLAFSASCCATCFSSTATVNSRPKVKCVMEMSSRIKPNCSARLVSSLLTRAETCNANYYLYTCILNFLLFLVVWVEPIISDRKVLVSAENSAET